MPKTKLPEAFEQKLFFQNALDFYGPRLLLVRERNVADGVKPTVQESIADPSGDGDPSIGAEFARKLAESQVGSVALGVDDGARYVVGTVDDIPPGSRKVILVNGREIGVFNVNGEYFAVLNRCPHQGGPLCSGRLDRAAGPRRRPATTSCPRARRGHPLPVARLGVRSANRSVTGEPAKVRVRSYDVTIESGDTLVAAVADDSTRYRFNGQRSRSG